MKLLIAEKRQQGETYAKALGVSQKIENGRALKGKDYIVTWMQGHLLTMAFPGEMNPDWKKWTAASLPMIPEVYKHKVIEEVKAQYDTVKKLMTSSEVTGIIAGGDAAREGQHIFELMLESAGPAAQKKPVERLWIGSLTKAAILDGMSKLKPNSAYANLAAAARQRDCADWLIGMNISRLLSCVHKERIAAGRVMTPTLGFVVKRDQEIENFKPQKYWSITAVTDGFTATCKADTAAEADRIQRTCTGKTGTVTNIRRENKKVNPPDLYCTSALQSDANKILGYSAKETDACLQYLYDNGLSSYPRVEAVVIGTDMAEDTRRIIKTMTPFFGFAIPGNLNIARICDDSHLDGGHTAIVPTTDLTVAKLEALKSDRQKEYNILLLILYRLIASVMPPREFSTVNADYTVEGVKFAIQGSETRVEGYRAAVMEMMRLLGKKAAAKNEAIPQLIDGMQAEAKEVNPEEKETKPPARYTEGTLIDMMKRAGRTLDDKALARSMPKGIGTEATRTATIEKLLSLGYIERTADKKAKCLISTELGRKVYSYMPEELKDPILTAQWEQRLSDVENGKEPESEFQKAVEDYVTGVCKRRIEEAGGSTVIDGEAPSSKGNYSQTTGAEIGKCPCCKKPVVRKQSSGTTRDGREFTFDGYGCTGDRRECGFSFAGTICGHAFTDEEVSLLLSGKTLENVSMISKAGKAFTAGLKVNKRKKQVEFVFANDDKSRKGGKS